ncbi:hypothetical protein UM876_12280 [Staphylococcus aureus]|nr:hypothetical protein UM876_12280 [Staphylococcus aureus]
MMFIACTADPGWVTGTSYGISAPWLNGATNCIAGGRFSPEQWYSMIEDFKVTHLVYGTNSFKNVNECW